MQLFVRDLAGKTLAVVGEGDADVASLKRQVEAAQGIPAAEQRLIFGGRTLDDSEKLGACGLQDESTLFLSLELLGGAKKRKKTYTKPKKIKHKRKKVKLAVLKFYKVDSNDKV